MEKCHYFLYGKEFTLETDQKPLVSIYKKHMVDISPRVQRLIVRSFQMGVSLSSLSWRTGPFTRSSVQLLTTGRNLNTRFSIRTAYCSSLMKDASSIPGQAQAKTTPIISNATPEAFSEGTGLLEKLLPSLVTRQGGDMTSRVWLNGKFHTKPWTQTVPEARQSAPDLIGDEVSEPELEFSDSVPEGT